MQVQLVPYQPVKSEMIGHTLLGWLRSRLIFRLRKNLDWNMKIFRVVPNIDTIIQIYLNANEFKSTFEHKNKYNKVTLVKAADLPHNFTSKRRQSITNKCRYSLPRRHQCSLYFSASNQRQTRVGQTMKRHNCLLNFDVPDRAELFQLRRLHHHWWGRTLN